MPFKNPEDRAAYMRRYWKKNWAMRRTNRNRYNKKYPWISNEMKARTLATIRVPRDKRKCRRIYEEVSRLNWAAGRIKWNVDHIKPLSKGGLHREDNLQILTAKDNIKKGGYYLEEKF